MVPETSFWTKTPVGDELLFSDKPSHLKLTLRQDRRPLSQVKEGDHVFVRVCVCSFVGADGNIISQVNVIWMKVADVNMKHLQNIHF